MLFSQVLACCTYYKFCLRNIEKRVGSSSSYLSSSTPRGCIRANTFTLPPLSVFKCNHSINELNHLCFPCVEGSWGRQETTVATLTQCLERVIVAICLNPRARVTNLQSCRCVCRGLSSVVDRHDGCLSANEGFFRCSRTALAQKWFRCGLCGS